MGREDVWFILGNVGEWRIVGRIILLVNEPSGSRVYSRYSRYNRYSRHNRNSLPGIVRQFGSFYLKVLAVCEIRMYG